MNKDYTVVFVTPEIMVPEFGEPACGANFRGGLGRLAGDIMDGLAKRNIKAIGIAPFYEFHWLTREKVDYGETQAMDCLKLKIWHGSLEICFKKIMRGGTELIGMMNSIFNVLYTADRWQRLQQEVLIGHAVPAFLKDSGIRPDIIWFQEGHTALVQPVAGEYPYSTFFKKTKFLFTTHTPVPEGMEKFRGEWIEQMKIHPKYYPYFLKDGIIDMTNGAMNLSDAVTAVSLEHEETTKKMFPEHSSKITGIRNGVSHAVWAPFYQSVDDSTTLNLWESHLADKLNLLRLISAYSGAEFDARKPVLGWVRRLAWYKNQYPMLAPIIKAICADRGEAINAPLGRLEGLGFQAFCAGVAHESDSLCLGWTSEFGKWSEELRNRFIFLNQYNLNLLRTAVLGCDVWFSPPMPKMEACGTSEMVAVMTGNINLTTCGGGAREHIKEFNPETREGNGFFIEPYDSMTVYRKLKIISDLYYAWIERGDDCWLKCRKNAFETGKTLAIELMIDKYAEIFERLLTKNGGK